MRALIAAKADFVYCSGSTELPFSGAMQKAAKLELLLRFV